MFKPIGVPVNFNLFRQKYIRNMDVTEIFAETSSQNRWNHLNDMETLSIIDNLGGIKNVVNLCLTHPNRLSTINDSNVSKIHEILA